MIDATFVHGINTDHDVTKEWTAALARGGVPRVEATTCMWGSTGTASGDIALLTTSPRFTVDALKKVCRALAYADEYGEDAVVIAHSMGTALLLVAEQMIQTGLRFVLIGSPLHHPVFQGQLAAAGLLPPDDAFPEDRFESFWNAEDPVAALAGKAVHPPYLKSTRVSVAGRAKGLSEHDAALYLEHPLVADAVRRAAR